MAGYVRRMTLQSLFRVMTGADDGTSSMEAERPREVCVVTATPGRTGMTGMPDE